MSDMLQLVVRFGGFQLTAEVTTTAANDKLKHIGHLLNHSFSPKLIQAFQRRLTESIAESNGRF